jgi:hypothetical protein
MGKRFICFLAFSIFAVGAAAAQTADCGHAMLMKWASEHGFQLQTSDGNELYCRKIVTLDSRIPRTQCGTEAELASYMFLQADGALYWTCRESRPTTKRDYPTGRLCLQAYSTSAANGRSSGERRRSVT